MAIELFGSVIEPRLGEPIVSQDVLPEDYHLYCVAELPTEMVAICGEKLGALSSIPVLFSITGLRS